MMTSSFRLLALLTILATTSCAFVRSVENEPLDPSVVRSLVPGQTTAQEVVAKLGAPNQIVELGQRSAYGYTHAVTKGAGTILVFFILANADSRTDRVWLFFDSNNVLTHVGTSFESHHAQYAFPWEDVHEAEDHAARDAGRTGLSK